MYNKRVCWRLVSTGGFEFWISKLFGRDFLPSFYYKKGVAWTAGAEHTAAVLYMQTRPAFSFIFVCVSLTFDGALYIVVLLVSGWLSKNSKKKGKKKKKKKNLSIILDDRKWWVHGFTFTWKNKHVERERGNLLFLFGIYLMSVYTEDKD